MRNLAYISIFTFFAFAAQAIAATITWDGSTDTDWATAANWDVGVPGSTDDVIIPGSLSNYPSIDETATTLSLTIASGATVTVTTCGALTSSGNIGVSGTLTVNAGSVTISTGIDIDTLGGGPNPHDRAPNLRIA